MPWSPASEPQISFAGHWFHFHQQSPIPVSYLDYSYGAYQRWVPPSATGQIQYTKERGAGPSSSSGPGPSTSSCPRGSLLGASGIQTIPDWMGPRAPSPVPQRRSRRARPSKRARTLELGESSSSRPQPSLVTSAAKATSSPQLSPASRIPRPLFVRNPIQGNVRLHRRGFHQESYYDVPALTADPRFRDSMRLIEDYSLLPFMTPRQYFYPRVVL